MEPKYEYPYDHQATNQQHDAKLFKYAKFSDKTIER